MEKMKFYSIPEVKVSLNFIGEVIPVGVLIMNNRKVDFIFDTHFLNKKIELSPMNCKLKSGIYNFHESFLMGLPGFIYDSLPDGWGQRLLNKKLIKYGLRIKDLSGLDQLCYVGKHGMGALVYEPSEKVKIPQRKISIETLAKESAEVISGEASEAIELLLSLNGSSGGARPKAVINLQKNKKEVIHGMCKLTKDYDPWIVKFLSSSDLDDAGAVEYVYALMAKEAGLDVPEVHLFPDYKTAGFFAVKRFDRNKNKRIHMHSVAGLLHADFRSDILDYKDLLVITMNITNDMREVEKMFQLAVYNVFSHNRDDHLKNFSFLMDETCEWKLSPAYDLTFSHGSGYEHNTAVLGNGKDPSEEDLIRLGETMDFKKDSILEIINRTKSALSQWKILANEYGVSKDSIREIDKVLIN